MGISYFELKNKGYFLVVTEAYCKYIASTTYDDEVEILTQIAELKNSAIAFDYQVKKKESLIASGVTKHAFVNPSGKAVRIPATIIEALNKRWGEGWLRHI